MPRSRQRAAARGLFDGLLVGSMGLARHAGLLDALGACELGQRKLHVSSWFTETIQKQGSLHYTPEHCLVNGGFPGGKSHVSNGQNVSFKEP